MPEIVARLSPLRASDVINTIKALDGPVAPYWSTITRLMFHSDDMVLEPIRMVVRKLNGPEQRKQWKALLPKLKDPYLIEEVREMLGLARYDDSYWVDIGDLESEEDELEELGAALENEAAALGEEEAPERNN